MGCRKKTGCATRACGGASDVIILSTRSTSMRQISHPISLYGGNVSRRGVGQSPTAESQGLAGVGRWQLGIGRDDQQFFTNEAAFRGITILRGRKPIHDRLVRFDHDLTKRESFLRPDRISGPSCPTFQLPRLVQIPNFHARWKSFFGITNTSLYLISLNTLCNVNLFILIQGANKVVVVVVVVVV